MKFAFRTAAEIHFGPGEAKRLREHAARFGKRPFLVTGSRGFAGIDGPAVRVSGEPDVATVDAAVRICRDERCDLVIGVGGGSVLDTAKAVAGMATNAGSVAEYLEDVGAKTLAAAPLPFVAAPTTAGSGSEATRNAVIRVPEKGVKRSLRHDLLLPRAAVVDPELSGAAPLGVAAAAGLDALTHLIESYTSTGAQPTTDALALPGARMAFQALRALAAGQADGASKEAMALASLWGGIALANAGLGAVHGLVAPLGGRRSIAHGNACACLLAGTVAANLAALRARAPDSPALGRYAGIAAALGERSPDGLAGALDALRRDLGVPALAAFGLRGEDIPAIVKDSRGSSMKFNPVVLSDDELAGILTASL
jgi:alcohol dehydrogenase class IV